MPDRKISALAEVTDIQDADQFVLARAGASKRISGANLESELLVAVAPDLIAVLEEGNNAGAFKITNLHDPTSNQDAATKAYVDTHLPDISGLQATSEKDQVDGYSGLDGNGLLDPDALGTDLASSDAILVHPNGGDTHWTTQLPSNIIGDSALEVTANKDQPSGYAGLDANGAFSLAAVGFFGVAPVPQPEVPAAPTAQDVVDALVALGLVTQAT